MAGQWRRRRRRRRTEKVQEEEEEAAPTNADQKTRKLEGERWGALFHSAQSKLIVKSGGKVSREIPLPH